MAISFEVRHTEGLSRLGTLHTPHGEVETPALMPVINPNLELIPPSEMERRWGVQMVITNSYIIRQTKELRRRATEEGLHAVLDWDGVVMTDSGTFQDYVYGDVKVQPEEIVSFQREIGTDIATILDVFSTPDRTYEQAREDVVETTRRAQATHEAAGEMALNLPVQGATFPDLREQAARELRTIQPLGGAVHPIGGVVPIMEQQRYSTLARIILGAKRGLHPGRPVHLFGAGHPHMLALAVYLGCDLFDSAAYAKFAQGGRLLFPWGTEELSDLEELPGGYPIASDWTVKELKAAKHKQRLRALASHNLQVTFGELARVREAQRRGRLFDLVLERAVGHPTLLETLEVLQEQVAWIEAEEPLSYDRALQLAPPYHEARPQLARVRRRLEERVHPRGPLTLLGQTRRPFTEHARGAVGAALEAGLHPHFPTRLGPVPFELDQVYPFTQSVEPPLTRADQVDQEERLQTRAKALQVATAAPPEVREPTLTDHEALRTQVEGTIRYQFGAGAAEALLQGEPTFETSPRTGKLRTVHVDDEHVLSLRASDGLFTLKLAGARRLHVGVPAPRLRLAVTAESAPFNADKKSVMGGFVTAVDEALRPGDEVLVVDPDDRLLGVGQLWTSHREAVAVEAGPVARMREGVGRDALET